jgi:hypothetical protein
MSLVGDDEEFSLLSNGGLFPNSLVTENLSRSLQHLDVPDCGIGEQMNRFRLLPMVHASPVTSSLSEIALVLVRFDHVARFTE